MVEEETAVATVEVATAGARAEVGKEAETVVVETEAAAWAMARAAAAKDAEGKVGEVRAAAVRAAVARAVEGKAGARAAAPSSLVPRGPTFQNLREFSLRVSARRGLAVLTFAYRQVCLSLNVTPETKPGICETLWTSHCKLWRLRPSQ